MVGLCAHGRLRRRTAYGFEIVTRDDVGAEAGADLDRLTAFTYLTVPDRATHLAIMRVFTSTLLADLSAHDVAERLPGDLQPAASAFAPGEALHCVAVRGLTVDAALAKIGKRHVTVPEFHVDEVQADGSVYGKNLGRDKIPGTWFVRDADPLAPGQVRLWVGAKPPKSSNGGYHALLNKGC
jgi:hypothetical protein